jgi:enhancing lycopene biosynthesis protein 2
MDTIKRLFVEIKDKAIERSDRGVYVYAKEISRAQIHGLKQQKLEIYEAFMVRNGFGKVLKVGIEKTVI